MDNIIGYITSNNMIYSQILSLLPILLAGIALGLIFFAGLWWTVQLGSKSPHPAIYFVISFILRVTIVLVGIYLLMDGQWPRLLACMLGFISARFIVITVTRPSPGSVRK